MLQFVPITLLGNNLGERHRHLNSLVNDAYESSIPFKTIQDVDEASPVDRLFKIDLASKHKDVDYIIHNLKESDLLFVSRSLKCRWLLEPQFSHIINPNYLEDKLYPEMRIPAVNKMKHWIQHHLKDPGRCRIFYNFYKKNEFELAVKFLWHCSNEYIHEEFDNIVTRINPKQLKILSEKCPQLSKIFYERLERDTRRDVVKHYLNNEAGFLHNIKYLLKSEPDTFFYVVEKYYVVGRNTAFRSDITQHIMEHHKDKFFEKPELYTVHLLDINTLAKCLSPEEAKDLVVKLAHAAYLGNWFTYKTVEPFILRLDKDERVVLKKQIFVDKDLGEKNTEWPYDLPTSPVLKKKPGYSLFQDKVHSSSDYIDINFDLYSTVKCERMMLGERFLKSDCYIKKKPLLDELFNHYRFTSFERTFFELRNRLRTESSPQNRQLIMLVLVSKCGGRENSVRALFGLLAQYKNEPIHLRAAIVRSLVKHAFVWRLPEDLWSNLLEWGHGLGLDGSEPEAACDEGLHAVVLRDLLSNKTPKPSVLRAFLNHFTDLTEYSMTPAERCCIRACLPNFLIAEADKETGSEKLILLNNVLNTLHAYNIPFSAFPSVITTIATDAPDDPDSYEHILHRLFVARAGRRQLFKANFSRIQNNASYMNALRHDTTVLDPKQFKLLCSSNQKKYTKYGSYKARLKFHPFFRKLIIYFAEDGGLAKEFYGVLKLEAEKEPFKLLARPLALLAGNDLPRLLKIFDSDTKRRPNTAKQSLAAALRANAHVSRPPLDLNVIGWEEAGVKAVANMVSICPKTIREEMITKLTTWKRALRLALALTKNEDTKYAIFKAIVASRPGAALKIFLRYLKSEKFGNCFLVIWNVVKPLITKLDYSFRDRLRRNLNKVSVPETIKSEYFVLVYKVFLNVDKRNALPLLCEIENICFEVDETFLYDALKIFLENDFKPELVLLKNGGFYHSNKCSLHILIIAKFLLLCSSEEMQKKRLEVIGEPFFARFEDMWRDPVIRKHLARYLFDFLSNLKYNRVIFDVKYVSCMPVFAKVVSWMQSMLSVEKWFDSFVNIRLTMLYHKAARYCLEQKPGYFNTDPTNLDKGIEMFGAIFGELVSHEYEQLRVKYFQSIKEIYIKELMNYIVIGLNYRNYDESKENFAIAFVKSILTKSESKDTHVLALYVLKEHVLTYFHYDYDLSDIMNMLKDNIHINNELRFNFEMMVADDTKRLNKINKYIGVPFA